MLLPCPDLRYPARPGFFDFGHGFADATASPSVVSPNNRERERKVRKRGRKVAIADAVMPRPCSDRDQIATSVVAHRKSDLLAKAPMYGKRAIVAAEALFSC